VTLDDLRALVTVAAFVAFVGVVVWAYSRGSKRSFDEAARLPFADEVSDLGLVDERARKAAGR
jgi:cytochrome c oxidase cbb3-type subunit 4